MDKKKTMLSEFIREFKFYYAKIRQILNTDSFWNTVAALVRQVQDYQYNEFKTIVADLANHPVVQGEKAFKHHVYHNRFNHMLMAARFAYYLADNLELDVHNITRAAMIHDLHSRWYNTRDAVDFAKMHGENDEVQEMIRTHMVFFPYPPRTVEGWIIVVADNLALGCESFWTLRYLIRRLWLSLIFDLRLHTVTV